VTVLDANDISLDASSTMMAITSGPPQVGPYEPETAYSGDIPDSAALERWISDLVAQAVDRRTTWCATVPSRTVASTRGCYRSARARAGAI
jgi:hypothetical protein